MKRMTGIVIAGTLMATASAVYAGTLSLPQAFGPAEIELVLDDARLDADRLFDRIDMNRDGALSIDEYASQAVVRASLSRFNGAVVFDGAETFHVILPEEATKPVRVVEQTAIDAVARNEFYQIAGEDEALSRQEWISSRLNSFAQADFDEDGTLEGNELAVYAMSIARYNITFS